MSAAVATPPPLIEVVCPRCLPRRNVMIRAAKGSIVEAYCRHCKYRKVIVVS
jgi:NMD protein affecting ribosome stability and mRNA decay